MSLLPGDLDPSTDQARQWLSDELAKTEYHDTRSLLQRFMTWLLERLADLQDSQGTGGVSLPPIVITLVVAVLLGALLYLLTRIRRESRQVEQRDSLLGGSLKTAEQLREEAEQALAEHRFADAVVAWTRAIARDAEQRTVLREAATMTAREVGAGLVAAFPDVEPDIRRTMDLFDAVAYGGASATRTDALIVRATDERLRGARPRLPSDPSVLNPPSATVGRTHTQEGSTQGESVWMTGIRS